MEKSFLAFVEQSIKQNWDLDALTDYKGATLQYKDLARKIEKLHILLEESGVQPGDKVAICGRNSSHWGVAFLATLTYGAIAVPILHEFKADTIHNIVMPACSLWATWHGKASTKPRCPPWKALS